MIKRRQLIIIVLTTVVLLVGSYYLMSRQDATFLATPDTTPAAKAKATPPQDLKINGRRVINLQPGKEKEIIAKVKVSNKINPNWQQNVEKVLKAQGGDSLKDIKINKVESLIWSHHGLALNVESVQISLKNEKGERTSFRAMIDSQTGKILQTWDHPVIDPVNPREEFRVKVDPRYFQD